MLLDVRDIVSGYGEIEVLHGVSLQVKDVLSCIIGPNGSGKSTLLKSIVGIVKPWSGRITLNGENITNLEPHVILEKGIAMVPQGRTVFMYMTVLENLEMGAYRINDRDKVEEGLEMVYNEFPILKERSKQLAGKLSGGEQTMLCIGRALMARPKIVLFDEPSLGLAPKYIKSVYQKILDINRSGKPIVIVEQNVRKALSVADYVYVLDFGRNIFEGRPEWILRDKKLQKLYLGRLKDS